MVESGTKEWYLEEFSAGQLAEICVTFKGDIRRLRLAIEKLENYRLLAEGMVKGPIFEVDGKQYQFDYTKTIDELLENVRGGAA